MRMPLKSWKGRRNTDGSVVAVRHTFNMRIIWYEEGDGLNIRLSLEDEEGRKNHYPANEELAQKMWDEFKAGKLRFDGSPYKR